VLIQLFNKKEFLVKKDALIDSKDKNKLNRQSDNEIRTLSGYILKNIYTPDDLKGFDPITNLGLPGEYPYIRGITKEMYREKIWSMGQYSGFGTAKESNQRFRYLISKGQTGLGIALDLPTQLGLDSDDPQAEGEVGKVGVAIDSLQDMEILFDGIPLDRVGIIRTTANAIGPIVLALFLALGEKKGFSPQNYIVRLQNDVLKEYVARGTYIFPPKPSVKLVIDTLEYCARYIPHWLPLTICGSHMRHAGGLVKHELGFAFANGMAYLDEAIARGLKIDDFAPKLTFHFLVHNDFFEEIAKFRAARKLWANIIRDQYQSKNSESQKMHISAYTAGVTLTAQQPLNNIVRVTIQALAAVLGGVQYLATSSYDEALCLPSEEAVTVALRTQQIIAHESGVANIVDPLGGSYFLEFLTCAIEKDVIEVLKKVKERGGAIHAILDGYYQREIMQAAVEAQKQIDTGQRVIVGVNKYQSGEEIVMPDFQVDPSVEREQIRKLRELRKQRNNSEVMKALKGIEKAAKEDKNLVPFFLEAVKVYATIGEICNVLREIYGEFKEPIAFLH